MSGLKSASTPSFPIPASLQDLERAPYNLLPYPHDFADEDEAARADSFENLVILIESGNRTLNSGGLALFEVPKDEEDFEEWMDGDRVQALYTLVRKSSSLAPATRKRLIDGLCQAVHGLCSILSSPIPPAATASDGGVVASDSDGNYDVGIKEDGADMLNTNSTYVMPQNFRDALACHIYMLFSVMFFIESEAKVGNKLHATSSSTGGKGSTRSRTPLSTKKEKERKAEAAEVASLREACARAMLAVAQSMGKHKSRLWKRGVPDEAVVGLPCRIAYQMLESATGVIARKTSSADAALGMIAATVDSAECLLGTIVAALVDLLHSYEHMAPLVAELCCMVSENPINRLAVELLREIGRLDTNSYAGNSDAGGKASGIKNVAPFISELASVRPRIVLSNLSFILPHLDSEPYALRSSIVTALGHILVRFDKIKEEDHETYSPSSPKEGSVESNEVSQDNGSAAAKGGPRSINLAKNRTAIMDILIERVHDISSFTRVSVLKAWANLTANESLPLDRVMPVTAMAIDRLQDKTVMVRRSAMQLLTLLLENNPFMGSLDPMPYERKVSELEAFLKENIPTHIKEAKEAALAERDRFNSVSQEEIETAALAAAISQVEASTDWDNLSDSEVEFYSKVKALKFTSSALAFIGLFEDANRAFETMLLSSNASDVTEALRFFVRARHFQLPCAVTGMKQALALMWSSETSIQDEVLQAFVEVFIAVPGTSGEELLTDNQIAHNLLVLVGQATASELASIEEAIGRLVKQERIPAEVFMILWSVASKASGEARAAAFTILSMGASADPNIVDTAARLRLLLESGLGEHTEEHRDWKTARSAACALQRIGRGKSDPASARYIVLEQITERLCEVARGDWCVDENARDTKCWFSVAEQAIGAIFVVSTEPEKASADIIRGLEASTFGFDSGSPFGSCHSLRLARFFFVVGHIALKLLVYTEELSGAVRHANAAKTLSKQESADKAKASKKTAKGGKSPKDDDSDGGDTIEAELGVAAEAEAETERKVAEISEKEIVGRGLIGLFGPLLVRVVRNEGGAFSSEILMQSSTLALCKFMCISESFCEKHLPLLFTVLANAPRIDTTLRANTVVALGDLAFRFPNAVEPYTPRLYACLRDTSTRVRRHTLMVLTHLILNDMVKVKGQVCEIALCLRDKEARIRDMARLLFHELSKRSNNPIYNLLPDIVSRLSQMSLKRDDFRNIMSFLLSFVKKERQNEMLLEKLCHRFPKCTSISQKADLSFCLAQLKVNEKCIKSLNDLFKLYKDALFDEDVHKNFAAIIAKAKKFPKPEMKECLDEWESKLNEQSAASMENHLAGSRAERAKARAARRGVKNGLRTGRKTKQVTLEYEGESDEEEGISSGNDDSGDKENTPVEQSDKMSMSTPRRNRSRTQR